MADVVFYCAHCGRNLQADANSAGMQVQCPQCGYPVTIPQWSAAPAGPAPSAIPGPTSTPPSMRPTSVTVFGILSIVFGGLGLACTPVGLIVLFLAPTAASQSSSVGYAGWTVISSLIGLAAAGWLLACGIGLLRLRPWARSGAVAYGWFAIIFGIGNMVINVAVLLPGDTSSRPEMVGGYIGGACGGILGLIYPILLLVFMTRPHVIEVFRRQQPYNTTPGAMI